MTDQKLAGLPFWPRGLRTADAAAYVGMSQTLFRGAVDAGDAPQSVALRGTVKVWLKEDLDAWLDKKAGRAPALPDDVWNKPRGTGRNSVSAHLPGQR